MVHYTNVGSVDISGGTTNPSFSGSARAQLRVGGAGLQRHDPEHDVQHHKTYDSLSGNCSSTTIGTCDDTTVGATGTITDATATLGTAPGNRNTYTRFAP